jgi:hypothetical protein
MRNDLITTKKQVGLLVATFAQSICLKHDSGHLLDHLKHFVNLLGQEKAQVLDCFNTAI